MSYGLCEIVKCEAVQQSLDQTFVAKNMRAETLPFLSYVLSPENRAAIDVPIVEKPSKAIDLKVIFDQPFLTSEVTTNGSGCTATDEPCDCTKTYAFDPTQNIEKSFVVGPADLTGTCEENSAFIARKTQKLINVLKEKVSEDLAASVAAQVGKWSVDTNNIPGINVNASDILEVNTSLNNGTGSADRPNAALFEQLNMALTMSRFENSGVFGSSGVAAYLRQSAASGVNSDGYSQAEMLARYGVAMQYDRHLTASLQSIISADAIAVGIGAVAPLGFSLYEAEANKLADDSNIADTVFDPQTGMKFDLRITRPCDDWHVIVRARYDFITWPDDMYKSGSNYEGVKSLAPIVATCDDLTPCQ